MKCLRFQIDAELSDLPVLKRACERYLCGELNTVGNPQVYAILTSCVSEARPNDVTSARPALPGDGLPVAGDEVDDVDGALRSSCRVSPVESQDLYTPHLGRQIFG